MAKTYFDILNRLSVAHECDRQTCDSRSQVRIPAMTLPGYFWDRWPYFAGKLSWNITTTQVNSALHPSGVAKSSTSFGLGKGEKVTSAGWQVTLCDLIWHVISRSGVVISITNCYIRFTLLLLLQTDRRTDGETDEETRSQYMLRFTTLRGQKLHFGLVRNKTRQTTFD